MLELAGPLPLLAALDPTVAPRWDWYAVLYFFLGGLAGGAFFLAACLDLVGAPEDRPVARRGYLLALPALALGAILLIMDLDRPERFWHMLVQSETGLPMFKPWSPMSIGAWGLLLFGPVALLAALSARGEGGRWPGARLGDLRHGAAGRIVLVLGMLLALFLCGYTGVLLSVTNRPLWADTWLLGLLFLVSGVSTGAALLLLVAPAGTAGTRARLSRLDAWLLVLELVVLVALGVALGRAVQPWLGPWGLVLLLGVVGAGIAVPLAIHLRAPTRPRAAAVGAVLVLLGGLLLRFVVVYSVETL